MQKIVNVISIFSGLVSLTIVGATGYVYLNRDSIIENATANITAAATKAITSALPSLVDSAIPEMPEVTGGVTGVGGGITGPAIPLGR
tara:strand:+ start:270 stop:533 length:264 start_codon:yes stop_codon:yes gene_type:complete